MCMRFVPLLPCGLELERVEKTLGKRRGGSSVHFLFYPISRLFMDSLTLFGMNTCTPAFQAPIDPTSAYPSHPCTPRSPRPHLSLRHTLHPPTHSMQTPTLLSLPSPPDPYAGPVHPPHIPRATPPPCPRPGAVSHGCLDESEAPAWLTQPQTL